MKKTLGFSGSLIAIIVLTISFVSSCKKKDYVAPNWGSQIAGTAEGQLGFWLNAEKKYDSVGTIKITDLGNNRIKVESGNPSRYSFTPKELNVEMVDDKIIQKIDEVHDKNNITVVPGSPSTVQFYVNYQNEIVSFIGVKK